MGSISNNIQDKCEKFSFDVELNIRFEIETQFLRWKKKEI